jgi:hypothetical protein
MEVALRDEAPAGAAEGLVFTALGGETIVGGEITMKGYASGDPGYDDEPVGQEGLLASPSESDVFGRLGNITRTFTVPPGGTQIWARELCSGSNGPTCGYGSISITSAHILLSPTSATPSVSPLSGPLTTSGAQHGTQDVSFTATDPGGPGIYQATGTIDGKVVYQTTPNLNGGACAPVGSYGATLEFYAADPCPQSVPVSLPIETGTLGDGIHSLVVTATDAAGNVSAASQVIFRTENLISTASAGRVARTGTGGEPAYLVQFDGSTNSFLLHGVRRSYADSALMLSGTLTTPQDAVAPDVPVHLFARGGSGTEMMLASTTSDAAGHWSLTAPKGSSRTLRIGYGQANAANTPVDTAVKESVSPSMSLRIRDETGGHLSFTGRVSVSPLARPYPIVVIEASSDVRHWQIVGHQVRTGSAGVFHLSYSSAFSVGGRFAFRASTPETSLWLQGATKPRWLRVR